MSPNRTNRFNVETANPIFVAVPHLPVLDGYASSSGESFHDDVDDAARATTTIDSASGIVTPTVQLLHLLDCHMCLMLNLHLGHILFAMFELCHCFQIAFLVLNPVFLASNNLWLKSQM